MRQPNNLSTAATASSAMNCTTTWYGRTTETEIFLKNGYLCATRDGGLKLSEFKHDLFFTPDGEAVIFHHDQMSLGNRPYVKKK